MLSRHPALEKASGCSLQVVWQMNDREAIEKIIEAARLTGLAAFIGETQLAGWGESHDSGAKVTMWLPDSDDLAPFRGMTTKKGKQAGQRLVVVAFEIGEDEQPVKLADLRGIANVPDGVPEQKPFGKYAAELHRLGWFFNRDVLTHIGTDEEYRAWVKSQPCCAEEEMLVHDGGIGGSHLDYRPHSGDVVAAHVRRIADGAGTGIKPPYSAIPLCDNHHRQQHDRGESAIGGKEWLDKQRNKYLKEWASKTLAAKLGYDSMGMVPPDELANWAMERGLLDTLPPMYRG